MQSMSKNKLERIAVDSINIEANKPTSLLSANIPVGDKGISFDGDIEVYKDETESVESLIGKVPVQVKGTEVAVFTMGSRSFSLGLDHLSNYYNSNGVILFVVEINKSGETKIFYKQLLPSELRLILKKYGEEKKQKHRTLELRPLSESSLDVICRKFLKESKKQPAVLIEHNPFKEDEFSSFQLTSLTFDPNKSETSNIFEHDFTVYGVKESLNVPLKQARIHSVTSEITDELCTNGNKYEFTIKETREQQRTVIIIEDSLELTISNNNTKFNFKITKLNSLSAQLKILPFILDFLSGKSIEFKTLSKKFENIALKNTKGAIKDFQRLYSTFEKLETIFRELNVPVDIKIDNEPGNLNKLIENISSFVKMYLDKDYSTLKINNPEQACFTLFSIGDLKLVFFYNPRSETLLTNAFSEKLIFTDTRISIDGKTSPHSPYVMMTSQALALGANVNLAAIKKSFDSFNPYLNEITTTFTNDFCLMCIHAFDISSNIEFLDLAEYIYSKYKGEHQEQNIVIVNQYQLNIRRNGFLNDEEIEKLIKLKHLDMSNIELQFCTSVLLESKFESKSYFNQLKAERQDFYKQLPIYTLYKKLILE
jgi:hypothetical protein